MEKYKNKIAVLIPAYNEEERIGAVLDLVTQIPFINQIVVVNDGSKDKTAYVVSKYPVTLINHPYNRGKTAALKSGLESVNAEFIVSLDSDLTGLKKEHILSLLQPVLSGKLDMAIAQFVKARAFTDIAHRVSPVLSGQRAARIRLWQDIFVWAENNFRLSIWRKFLRLVRRNLRGFLRNVRVKSTIEEIGYGIEILTINYLQEKGLRYDYIPFKGVSHVIKEEKKGLVRGFLFDRVYKMYGDLIRVLSFIRRQQKNYQNNKGD